MSTRSPTIMFVETIRLSRSAKSSRAEATITYSPGSVSGGVTKVRCAL